MGPAWKKALFVDGIFAYMLLAVLLASFLRGHIPTKDPLSVAAGSEAEEDPYQEANKKVALTFDDGPNADYTEALLEGLAKRGVKATFFLLGREVERHPEIVRAIHEQGHAIGNHSYRHEQLSRLSDEEALAKVSRTNELIYDITGEYPLYLRPPYGDWKDGLENEAHMMEALWDVDPRDWATKNASLVVERVMRKAQDGDIILMHDASSSSVKAALEIVDRLQEEGFEFVTLEELLLE